MKSHAASRNRVVPAALPPQHVPRPRLSGGITRGVDGPLTLLSAGPGWGKTVLLSSWVEDRIGGVAWLSLEGGENDAASFWPLVGEALSAAGMIEETDGFSLLPHSADGTTAFLRALLRVLPASSQPVLIVDDAHLLTDEVLLAELDALIRYGFPQFRLILSARSDPLLPLHRYRLAGQMTELRAKDMAMTRSEARALLRAHGVRLGAPELELLTRRTEGWTAGLRLSAMSMAGSAHPERFVTRLALDQGSVGEYLMEEVLQRQPEDVRRLLIQTSFLDEVTGELAAAITGIEDSAWLLAELSRTNSFVVPVDHDAERYRYHQLFAEILRYLLKYEYPAEAAALRRRAARWYADHDSAPLAIRFAIEGEDWLGASAVLVRGGFARTFVDRQDVLSLGLRQLTAVEAPADADVDTRGELRVAQAVVAALSGELDDAAKHLEDARGAGLHHDAGATARLVEVVAAQRAGSVAALDESASALLASCEPFDRVRGTAGLAPALRLAQASAHHWAGGALSQVEKLLSEALGDPRLSEVPSIELECLGFLQLAYTAAGRSERARDCEARTQALVRRGPRLRRMTVHHLASAHAAFLRGDQTGARRAIARADELRKTDSDASLAAAVVLMGARIHIASDRLADAYHLLRTARELAGALPALLDMELKLTLADIDTRLGRPNAALKQIEDAGLDRRHPLVSITTARAYVELGEAAGAAQALRPTLVSSDNAPPLPALVEALLISARVAELGGDEARAVEEVLRAAVLGSDAIRRPFDDARRGLAGLLERHSQAAGAWPATGPHEASLNAAARPHLSEHLLADGLTDRETAVLRRLATTMSAAEIADELCVSINTVKTHIAAIYRKLPAANRRDAVNRARQMELL